MTAKTLKNLLTYVDDNTEVVVGCEGYCNYCFEDKKYFDGDDGLTKLTRVDDKLVLHPRNDYPYSYR